MATDRTTLTGVACSTGARDGPSARRWSTIVGSAALTVPLLLASQLVSTASAATAVVSPVPLGTAASYSALAGEAVVNTGHTLLSGNVGVSPGTAITGFPPGTLSGAIHSGDPDAIQARIDLTSAYNDAAGRSTTNPELPGDLKGLSYYPGIYKIGAALTLTGTLTLDGNNDPTAVFIFQVSGALTPAAASDVKLINGAQASHVFWQVDGAVTIDAGSSFAGTIMAAGAITVGASAELIGRALSYGTVTLASNLVMFDRPIVPLTGVSLGTSATYSVLAGTAVTNTLESEVSGDLGAITDITGFPPGLMGGTKHLGDVAAVEAVADLTRAYDDAARCRPDDTFAGDQIGRTFVPGIHRTRGAFELTGTLTLDGKGDPNAVFIFQVDAALNTAAASNIVLINGAQAANVFWQVNGAAGTGANSTFAGTILAYGAITVGAGTNVSGRVLSYAAITLNGIVIIGTPPGTLSITVPTDSADLGARPYSDAGQTVSGQLGVVGVSDTRGSTANGWVVSVVATDFVLLPGAVIPAGAVSYAVGTITTTVGTASYATHDLAHLTTAAAVVAATANGVNAATWNPMITVSVPGGAFRGVYTSTITHSVL